MKFVHGHLTMDVPEDWYDQSTIAFAEPPDRSVAVELAKRAAASGAPLNLQDPGLSKPRTNFVLSSRPAPRDVDPEELIRHELLAMLGSMPTVKVDGDVEWAEMGGSKAATLGVEVNFEAGSTLKQFHALAVMENRLIHFCGTTTPGAFAKRKPEFLAIMASIRIGEDAPTPPEPIFVPQELEAEAEPGEPDEGTEPSE